MATNTNLAVSYYMMGLNFQESAKKISETLETNNDGTPKNLMAIPFYFLVSHAAELYLKSALLKRGFDETKLKEFSYRHNLSALLEELQKKGVSITPETIDLIDFLYKQHKSHTLRYINLFEKNQLSLPPFQSVFSMLNELFGLTRISTQGI
jgi:hypothetical protein